MTQYLAHISMDEPQRTQSVETHCQNTAAYAAQALSPVSLAASGYLAGLIHDIGKYADKFQNYLIRQIGTRGSVNHTFAGVRLLLERYHAKKSTDLSFADIVCEVLAVAVGGHHGLFDCISEQGKNGFEERLTRQGIDYDQAVNEFFRCCVSSEELDQRFYEAEQQLTPVLERISNMTDLNRDQYEEETHFYSGLLCRLILSAVIDGDRQDTAEFMRNQAFPQKRTQDELDQLWSECLARVEQKLCVFPQISEIDKARQTISAQCKAAAKQSGGIFRLNVPTGGGKTLSSLRYALAHAKEYHKQHIIFTAPLLSILDQNAHVIRDFIQDDSIILEHHSNLSETEQIIQEIQNNTSNISNEHLNHHELLLENWDSPIIITTQVQLLHTLFLGKTSAIRRFHALCNSIIVIDEVQTIPAKMLSLFTLAMNFLAKVCGTTIVLCSATQPCVETLEHPLHTPIPDLVPYDPVIWKAFQRTNIIDIGSKSLEQIAAFASECLADRNSLLIVCNKKAQAEMLLHLLENQDTDLFHLSAAMCMAHRKDTLQNLRASLSQDNRKTICVSTQVIEAGIDISFACVIRLAAGMDSVVQAAGRCNRSGEAGKIVPVYVAFCQNEDLKKLADIDSGRSATLELFHAFSSHPEQFDHRLDSDKAISYYYHALYRDAPKHYHDYVFHEHSSILSLLAYNQGYSPDSINKDEYFFFRQAFRQAGDNFAVFDRNTIDVIAPYGEGKQIILDCGSDLAKYNPDYLQSCLKKAKPYTVSLFRYQVEQLLEKRGLIPLYGGAYALDGYYDEKTGFSMTKPSLDFLEV